MRARTNLLALCISAASACSNWLMPHDTGLSGRTTDLGRAPGLKFEMRTQPRGSKVPGAALLPGGVTDHAYVGIIPVELGVSISPMVTAGINEHGLTCDMQTLITTEMPAPSRTSADLFVEWFCGWALGGFADTDSVREALLNRSAVHVYGSALESGGHSRRQTLIDDTGCNDLMSAATRP